MPPFEPRLGRRQELEPNGHDGQPDWDPDDRQAEEQPDRYAEDAQWYANEECVAERERCGHLLRRVAGTSRAWLAAPARARDSAECSVAAVAGERRELQQLAVELEPGTDDVRAAKTDVLSEAG